MAADLDNNGALDLLASSPSGAQVWLATDSGFEARPSGVGGTVLDVLDITGDGVLDLVGLAGGQATRWVGAGTRGYHWKAIRLQAQQNAGDQRINSFGLGGEIEVRSGLMWQKQPITGPVLHFGLGEARAIDVARVVWPNGIPQAEFDPAIDSPLVAEQRLKGSCPWVFAHDGEEVRFVTDFLWRSPLGLRINAQDTAGVVQTEDWIRIGGDQLAPVDGAYDVRITAELWETHFFDHVSLMVVDHAPDTEVFVDERFSASRPPALDVHTVRALQPVPSAQDDEGRDVTALVAARDGQSLAGFAKGAYQGIAREHFVEFDLPEGRGADRVLVAQGWVYPTDSSINMAIAQGSAVRPSGRGAGSAESATAGAWWTRTSGSRRARTRRWWWTCAALVGATRLRLRTNLEVYWDRLAIAERVERPAADHAARRVDARSCAIAGSPPRRRRGATRPRRPLRADRQRVAALARPGGLLHALRRREARCSRAWTIAT